MQSVSVFLDITKTADVSRTKGLCHETYVFFESSLGEVLL